MSAQEFFTPISNMPYFDDCPICQYVMRKELNGEPLELDELQDAFDAGGGLNSDGSDFTA